MLHEPLPATSQTAAWDRAAAKFDQWRGACIDTFAAAEATVTRTLIALAQSPRRLGPVKPPMLVGQRFSTLEDVIAGHAPFGGHGRAAIRKLVGFRDHHVVRTNLCHAAAQITLDRRGDWVAVLRMTVPDAVGVDGIVLAFDANETTRLLAQIQNDASALSCALGHIRKVAAQPE